MFFREELQLRVGFTVARARLVSLARGDALLMVSRDAYTDGFTGLLRVGPLGTVPGASRLVRVQFVNLTQAGNTAGLGLRWEVSGPGGGLFPVLDADIMLHAAGPELTSLTIAGSYRPPLGTLGAALDHAILHRVADATIRNFIGRVAAGLTDPQLPAEPGTSDLDTARVPSEPEMP